MKKFRLSVVIAAALLLVSAVGCSHSKTILGKWKCITDYSAYMTAVIDDMATQAGLLPEEDDFIVLQDISCPVSFTFREDGSYEIAPEQADAEQTVRVLREPIAEALEALLQKEADAMKNGTAVEDLVQTMQAQSVTELSERFFSDSDLLDAVKASALSGTYYLEGTKLYFSQEDEGSDKYVDATVILDTLTISASHGFTEEEEPFASYPVSLERIAD